MVEGKFNELYLQSRFFGERKGGLSNGSKDTHYVGSHSSGTCAMLRATFTWEEPRMESIIT